MRFVKLFSLLVLISSAAYALSQDNTDSVKAALDKWVKAVESRSMGAIVQLYAPDAVMISAFAHEPLVGHKALAQYYQTVVVNPDIKVDVTEQHPRVMGDVAVNSGKYTMSYTQEGEPVVVPGRFTFVYAKRGDDWIITDHHSSDVPMHIKTADPEEAPKE